MVKKKQPGFRLRKLDKYSVIVTLIAVLVIAAAVGAAAAMITRHGTKAPAQTMPYRVCNCPMIPAGANPADYCRC